MNHAPANKANISTSISLSKAGPIILMLASRHINRGEELLFDYNSDFLLYNTKGFE
jgi:hypothetical protein